LRICLIEQIHKCGTLLRGRQRGGETLLAASAIFIMLEFKHPIPVTTELGDGMAIYAVNSGTFSNDVWTIVLHDGRVRHFRTDQLTIEKNLTWNIDPKTL